MLLELCVRFHSSNYVCVTEWPPIWEIAAHSAYEMFSKYKYLFFFFFFFFFFFGQVFGVGISF